MQHVVSRAVRDIDTNTVREREKSIALWARPASGTHSSAGTQSYGRPLTIREAGNVISLEARSITLHPRLHPLHAISQAP